MHTTCQIIKVLITWGLRQLTMPDGVPGSVMSGPDSVPRPITAAGRDGVPRATAVAVSGVVAGPGC